MEPKFHLLLTIFLTFALFTHLVLVNKVMLILNFSLLDHTSVVNVSQCLLYQIKKPMNVDV